MAYGNANFSLNKWYSKESFQRIDQFLKLFPIFTSQRVKLAFGDQHTHKKINVKLFVMVPDFIDMSARGNVGQL